MLTDTFPGGSIGQIFATDRDPNDVLSFTQKLEPKSMFRLNRQDGSIVALSGLEPGRYMRTNPTHKHKGQYDMEHFYRVNVVRFFSFRYQINATVSDGRFAVIADVSVQVEQVTDILLSSALTLRFSSLSVEDLLSRYLNQIRLTLRALSDWKWSPGQQDPVHILGVQPVVGTSDIDLVLAMERPENSGGSQMEGFYSQQELLAKLEEAAAQGQMRGILAGAALVGNTCSGELDCGDRVCENTLVMESDWPVTYSSERISLVLPAFRREETCTCPGETNYNLAKKTMLMTFRFCKCIHFKVFVSFVKCLLFI